MPEKEKERYSPGEVGFIVLVIFIIISVFVALGLVTAREPIEYENTPVYGKQIEELTERVNQLSAENMSLWTRVGALEEAAATKETEPVILEEDIFVEYEADSSKERLPECDATNTYRCMDYRKLTNTRSEQYALQRECYNHDEYGIRVFSYGGKDYFCAALGSAYGRTIGDTWTITLECGTVFNVILSDFKDDGTVDNFFGHSDINYDGDKNVINIVEFVVDMEYVPEKVVDAGTMSALPEFGGLYGSGGNVAKIEYTGQVWFPDK